MEKYRDLKKIIRSLFNNNVLYLLIGLIILPGCLYVLIDLFSPKHLFKWAKYNYRLYGVTESIEKPTFDWQHIKNHEVQKYLETLSGEHLPLRSWFIRIINQFYFLVFKRSYAYHNEIMIGKGGQLFEKYYIYSYCGMVPLLYDDPKKLKVWADKLQQLNEFFASRGKLFLYLITPNKAVYEPNAIPNRYHCADHETMHILQLKQLLDERHVPYLDGVDVIHQTNQKPSPSLFPKGGTHWNLLGATLFANQLIAQLNQLRPLHLSPISYSYKMTMAPHGTDHDLMSLMNLLKPSKHFPSPELSFQKSAAPYPAINVTFIGGSFMNQLLDVLHENKTFSKMDFYFYFKVGNLFYNKDEVKSIDHLDPTTPRNMQQIVGNDIVVLEENASNTISNHGDLFYQTLFSYYQRT